MDKIKFSITGENVSPDTLSFRKLIKILYCYSGTLFEISKSRNNSLEDKALDFSLSKIEKGSYLITVTDTENYGLVESNEIFTESVMSGNLSALPEAAVGKARIMANDLSSYGFALSLFSSSGKTIAFIPDDFKKKRGMFRDYTTIYGRMIQIGGINPNIHLEIPNRKTPVVCDISQEMVSQLVSKLYKEIGISGWVERDDDTLDIKRMKVEEILPYDPEKFNENIERLREIFREIHTDLSPDEYFERLRDGTNE